MRRKAFAYEIKAEVEFTGSELITLANLAVYHYDGVCKAAEQPGGVLYKFIGRYYGEIGYVSGEPLTDEQLQQSITVEVTFRELDLLAKIAEGENGYKLAFGMPVVGPLGKQLSDIMQAIKSEAERISNSVDPDKEYEKIYVDLPRFDHIGEDDDSWTNVGEFTTKGEAVRWIRDNIGECDDDGRIGLLTFGTPKENETLAPSSAASEA